jgi:hypothetical protein
MVGSISLASEALLLLLVPASNHQVKIECAKNSLRYQITLASQGSFERYGKKTRRERFLEEMDEIMPWAQLQSLIEPYYPKEGNDRPPVGLSMMLRIPNAAIECQKTLSGVVWNCARPMVLSSSRKSTFARSGGAPLQEREEFPIAHAKGYSGKLDQSLSRLL